MEFKIKTIKELKLHEDIQKFIEEFNVIVMYGKNVAAMALNLPENPVGVGNTLIDALCNLVENYKKISIDNSEK